MVTVTDYYLSEMGLVYLYKWFRRNKISFLSLPDSLSGVFGSEEEVVEPRGQQEGSDLADGHLVVDVDLAACLLNQLGNCLQRESRF